VSPVARNLTIFAAALVLLFAGGAAAGRLIDPGAPGGEAEAHGDASKKMDAMPDEHTKVAADPVRGLAVAEHGLRVVVEDPELRRGAAERLLFRVVDDRGATVRDFDIEHTKRMHLIVARRDLAGFQHLHPEMAADGTWSTPLKLGEAGSYRLFADFSNDGEATTLAADLRVDGDADLRPLPAPRPTAVSDGGYDIRLESGAPRAGQEASLRFTVTKDGRPVATQPYLGADGHLVALREGDSIGFAATFPTTGSYRLFLQFKVHGEVQTVAFTQEVE
jgi:hypothetical protein